MAFRQFHQWLYRDGRPNWMARAINWATAGVHSLGIAPNYMVTLEVIGRRSGRVIRFPLAMVGLDEERYLVSMLGANASWVRNVRAAGGHATLRHGRTEHVILKEVPEGQRGRVLQVYLRRAPGGRQHIPVGMDAPLEELEAAAAQFPIFLVVPDRTE